MLYIISETYLITWSLYLLILFTYLSSSPISGNHQFVLCVYESFCFVF